MKKLLFRNLSQAIYVPGYILFVRESTLGVRINSLFNSDDKRNVYQHDSSVLPNSWSPDGRRYMFDHSRVPEGGERDYVVLIVNWDTAIQ